MRQSRTLPASQRALPMVWPEFSTSSRASSSTCASTTAANDRNSRARSPGAMARHAVNAASARSIAVSVSWTEVDGTSRSAAPVEGLMSVVTGHHRAHIRSKERASSQSVTCASNAASSTSAMLT